MVKQNALPWLALYTEVKLLAPAALLPNEELPVLAVGRPISEKQIANFKKNSL
jgi:hypothetical protein